MRLERDLKPLSDDEYVNSTSLNAIDLMKFVMALGVVVLHTTPFKDYNMLVHSALIFGWGRFAVPFFFCTSSFLLFRKIDLFECGKEDDRIIYKYIKRNLILYVVWSVIYIPLIYTQYIKMLPQEHAKVKLILNIIFNGSYNHLWYLIATVYGTIIVYIFIRKKTYIGLLILIDIVLFLLGLSLSGYNKLLGEWWREISNVYNNFFNVKNGIVFAIPYISIGILVAKQKKTYNRNYIIYILITLYIIHLIEFIIIRTYQLNYNTDFTIIILPFSAVFVFFFSTYKVKKQKNIC